MRPSPFHLLPRAAGPDSSAKLLSVAWSHICSSGTSEALQGRGKGVLDNGLDAEVSDMDTKGAESTSPSAKVPA